MIIGGDNWGKVQISEGEFSVYTIVVWQGNDQLHAQNKTAPLGVANMLEYH